MWRFSRSSQDKLLTAHPILVEVFTKALAVSPVDFGISCGHRGKVEQMIAYQEGKSKLTWPDSKHNIFLSRAVDFFPYVAGRGAVWGDIELFYVIAGLVLGIGADMGFKLRWGGAWDGPLNGPGGFNDLPHIEILL